MSWIWKTWEDQLCTKISVTCCLCCSVRDCQISQQGAICMPDAVFRSSRSDSFFCPFLFLVPPTCLNMHCHNHFWTVRITYVHWTVTALTSVATVSSSHAVLYIKDFQNYTLWIKLIRIEWKADLENLHILSNWQSWKLNFYLFIIFFFNVSLELKIPLCK